MKTLSVKEFSKMYDGLELLNRTNEGMQLGDIFYRRGVVRRKLDFSGFNISFLIGLNIEKAEKLKEELQKTRAFAGEFAGIKIHDEISVGGGLDIPGAEMNLEGHLEQSAVKYFEIGKIKAKILRDNLRIQIRQLLRNHIAKEKKDFRQDLKNGLIAEGLYYGSEIRIAIDKKTDVDIEGIISRENIGEVKVGYDRYRNQLFVIKGSNYPFAIDLKKIKDFI